MSLPFMRSCFLSSALVLAISWAVPTTCFGQDGALELFSGESLYEDGRHLTQTFVYQRLAGRLAGSEKIADSRDLRLEQILFATGFDYGLREDLTLSILVPVIYRSLKRRTMGGGLNLQAFAQGDVLLAAKYRFFRTLWPRGAFNLAVIGGLELPTGDSNQSDDGFDIPINQQPGSGSWDPLLAVASTISHGRWRADALVRFKLNTKGAQDFDAPDVLTLVARAKYRFLHTKYPGPTAAFEAGFRYTYETGATQDGHRARDFGGDRLVMRLVLSSHPTPNTDLSVAYDIPVWQRYRGQQNDFERRVALNLGLRF